MENSQVIEYLKQRVREHKEAIRVAYSIRKKSIDCPVMFDWSGRHIMKHAFAVCELEAVLRLLEPPS